MAEAKESKDLVLAVAVFDLEYLQRKGIVYLLRQTFYKREKRGNGALWYDVVSTFFVLNFSIIRYVLTRGEGVNKSAVPWELQRKPQARLASTETQLSFLRRGHDEGRGWWHNACLSTPTARGYTLIHSRINPGALPRLGRHARLGCRLSLAVELALFHPLFFLSYKLETPGSLYIFRGWKRTVANAGPNSTKTNEWLRKWRYRIMKTKIKK